MCKVSFLYKISPSNGSKNINTIPVTFTIVIAIPLSLSSASITGAVAAMAEEPQTAFPLAIKNLKFCANPNFLPIYNAPIIVAVICNTINITPFSPISEIVLILRVAPSNTME